MRSSRRALTVTVILALACHSSSPGSGSGSPGAGAGSGSGGDPPGAGGSAACASGPITMDPGTAALALDGTAAPATISFAARSATGALDASALTWTASRTDDTPPGTVVAGVFTPYPYAGGTVTVTAADTCGHAAAASVTLSVKATVTTSAVTPPVVDTFGSTTPIPPGTPESTNAPSIVYPSDQTRFPRNIYNQLFQWTKNGGTWFRITFAGAGSTVRVYTDGAQCPSMTPATPPVGCWEADATTWAFVASSNTGGDVTVTVDGLAADGKVYASSPIAVSFSKRDVSGAIFYWSTTAAGVRRATVSDATPEPYVVAKPTATMLPNAGAVKCVACHTVSRSGRKMIGATQTATAQGMFVFDVSLDPPPVDTIHPLAGSPSRGFGTFSPDDTRVVVSNAGALAVYDAATGQLVTANLLAGKVLNGKQAVGTMPDWSPDGTKLAFAVGSGESPSAATDLAVIDYLGNDTWGTPTSVARASDTAAGCPTATTCFNLYPSFSPDSAWIAYSRAATSKHSDKTAQLWIAKADGSSRVELKNANRTVNNSVTAGQYENYMPTWAPPGDYQWIAFNSMRPYGVVYPTGGTQQIWVAAVDLTKDAPDPSAPAFRFSFQDIAENNHRAFWTIDVRDPTAGAPPGGGGGPPGGACVPLGQPCNQVTDTCCQGWCDYVNESFQCLQPPAL